MSTSRRRFLQASGASVAGFMVAGCLGDTVDPDENGTPTPSPTPGPTPTDDQVRIGVLVPQTGAFSVLGEPQQMAAELAVEQLNDDGGINGDDVVAIYEDTAGDPATARSRAERLVDEEEVHILTGEASSAASLAIQDYAEDEGIIYANQTGADAVTRDECNEYTFRYESRTEQMARSSVEYLTDELGTDVYFHITDYSYGQEVQSAWEEVLDSRVGDYEIVGESDSELDADDYSPYITSIISEEPDIAVIGMAGGDLVTFLSQAGEYDLSSAVDVYVPTNDFLAHRAGGGEPTIGMYGGLRYFEGWDSEMNRDFVAAYAEMHEDIPHNHSESQWTMLTQIIAPAIEEAGSTDADDLIPILEGFEFDSPMGPGEIRECDHQAMRDNFGVVQITEPQDFDWVPENDLPSLDILDTVSMDESIVDCEGSRCDLA